MLFFETISLYECQYIRYFSYINITGHYSNIFYAIQENGGWKKAIQLSVSKKNGIYFNPYR